jgi:hypothetical protein
LEADGMEGAEGEDHERHVRREVDGQPAGGDEHHRGRQQVAIGELVVGPAEERAGDGGDDEEHRPGVTATVRLIPNSSANATDRAGNV